MEIDQTSAWVTLSEDFANFTHSSGESVGIYLVNAEATKEMGDVINRAIAMLQGQHPFPVAAAERRTLADGSTSQSASVPNAETSQSAPLPTQKPSGRRTTLADFSLVMTNLNSSLVRHQMLPNHPAD